MGDRLNVAAIMPPEILVTGGRYQDGHGVHPIGMIQGRVKAFVLCGLDRFGKGLVEAFHGIAFFANATRYVSETTPHLALFCWRAVCMTRHFGRLGKATRYGEGLCFVHRPNSLQRLHTGHVAARFPLAVPGPHGM
jgi:hypothetical protein